MEFRFQLEIVIEPCEMPERDAHTDIIYSLITTSSMPIVLTIFDVHV